MTASDPGTGHRPQPCSVGVPALPSPRDPPGHSLEMVKRQRAPVGRSRAGPVRGLCITCWDSAVGRSTRPVGPDKPQVLPLLAHPPHHPSIRMDAPFQSPCPPGGVGFRSHLGSSKERGDQQTVLVRTKPRPPHEFDGGTTGRICSPVQCQAGS